jgi:hypothetical protein
MMGGMALLFPVKQRYMPDLVSPVATPAAAA